MDAGDVFPDVIRCHFATVLCSIAAAVQANLPEEVQIFTVDM